MKKILIALLFVFLTSCDKYTTYSLYIDNRTEDTIKIIFSEESPYSIINSDHLIFSPNNKKLFYHAEGDQMKKGCAYTGIVEGEVDVNTSSGRVLRKEIWDVRNWNCSGSNSTGWEKTFVITEDDLE